jgi:hypothetical protein
VCQLDQNPGIFWASDHDMTNAFGVTCRKLSAPFPDLGPGGTLRLIRLLTKIIEWPF